jgi:hypothetical protein
MSNSVFDFDFNKDGEQRTFDVIADGTICTVQMTVRPGGAGTDGWLTRARDGNSEHLNCEFVVVGGTYAKRKFWNRYTVVGSNHEQAIEISRKALKAMLESARGVRPSDESEAAKLARQTKGWGDFDQLRFVVRVGVEPAKNDFVARNTIREVITPERQAWTKPEQIDRSLLGNSTAATASTPAPASAPAHTITRPQWAG